MASKRKPRSPSTADIELGKRIRLRRLVQKMSQSELGDKIGVSFQQVQKYEMGVNRVGASRLQKLAAALGVPYTFFYDGDGKTRKVESLLSTDPATCLRLLRAFTSIKDIPLRRLFVTMAEEIVANQK
jgi:transcriptional regulator with XRE-family HTH domain